MGDSAVALRYAEALFALAKESGRTAEVLADLAAVKAALDAGAEGWTKVLHPRVPAAEKEAWLLRGPLAGMDRNVVNLVRLLIRRRREGILRDFFRAYLETHERKEGILRVEVETATPLGAGEEAALRERIAAATGRQVVLEARTLPELLGGIRILAGSRLVDGSVRSRLERIRRRLHDVPISVT